MIEAYTALFDLFEKFKIDYDIQEAIFKRHLGFFTTQILRAGNLNILSDDKIQEILNSESFNNLSKKEVFDEIQAVEYFKCMQNGDYEDAQKIIQNIDVDTITYLNLKDERRILIDKKVKTFKEHNTTLTEQNNILNNKLTKLQKDINSIETKTNDLTKENRYLKSENSNLKNELDEIKSKRLWKLLNRL